MKLIIFDCDGVLVNSEAIYIAAELKFLKQAGLDLDRRDYMKSFMGMPTNEWQDKLSAKACEALGKPLEDSFFEALSGYVLERFKTNLTAISGVHDAISAIGLRCCVASSSSNERLHWKLEHTGLAKFFEGVVFSSDMVPRGKPEPDLFLHAASAMNVRPENCIVIEDSANGVLAGKAAGMAVIGFNGGDHCLDGHEDELVSVGADRVIDDFAVLKSAIDQME
ncbi:MAG: HAD family phosphatase [Rhodospirillales bacterium]|jgi:HAD superfamily hydrolase (TIGR01509 family)|nr:HAD family phosphatase [Rhodospirillales bacterium]